MSEIKHTPGPWMVYRGDWSEDGNARYEIEGVRSINAADAQLISAAPELLQALRLCYDHCRLYYTGVESNNVGEAVRAAIAKATGAA